MKPKIKSRRFIPKSFKLDLSCLDKSMYRFVSNDEKTLLYVNPLIQTSLNEVKRGRSSFHNDERLMLLTKTIKERLDPQIRGIIKKAINSDVKLVQVGDSKMFIVDVTINKLEDGYEVLNPAAIKQ